MRFYTSYFHVCFFYFIKFYFIQAYLQINMLHVATAILKLQKTQKWH